MISVLSQLPSYQLIRPFLEGLTVLNPAEFIRVFSIIRMGAGSAFGAEYAQWSVWATSRYGVVVFFAICLGWIFVAVFVGGFIWSRGYKHAEEYSYVYQTTF